MRMQKRCDKSHFHQPLESNIPGSGISRCRAAENYRVELARHFAAGIMADEGLVEQVYMGEEETDEQTGVLKKLAVASKLGTSENRSLTEDFGREECKRERQEGSERSQVHSLSELCTQEDYCTIKAGSGKRIQWSSSM